MRKLLTILFSIISFTVVAQKPVQTLGNKFNRVKVLGEFQSDSAIVFPNDTIHLSTTDRALAFKGTKIYKWDGTKWGVLGDGVNGSVLNDSTLLLCNSGGCDTFTVHLVINNFSFTSDSTVRVCDASGVCDTINFNPTPLAKFYVDSVIIHNGANLDTLYYYVNGNAIVGGYIGGRYYNKDQIDSIFTVTLQNYYTQTQIDSINTVNGVTNESNHIISGGIVTYSGSGLTYYISACTYLIGGVVYNSPDTTITLDAADATNPRIDLFAVDTIGRALKITGVAASTPITPQVDPASQLTLTTGITLEANATTPTGTTSTLIYDENVEWTTGGTSTTNYNNTANPYHGTKDALVSYTKNQTLTFSGTTQTVNGQVLRAFIYLNNANYNFQFQFFNGTTAVSNLLTLNGFGFNPTLYNTYQNVSIPLTAFTWSGTNFDKLVITMTGKGSTGTYYLDYVSLEGGTPVPPTYSNKVDSVKMRNDSIFYVIKGVYYYSGFNAYQRSQTDSITAQLRSEIVSAAGGGVISFNGRNGAVVPDSTDYYDFYYTRHLVDSLLGLKENISDAFSGSYNDLTDKPVTVTNLSLGTVTSTSQAINNSNGTGVTLPSASISTAGLMTAGDKVLVNTITSKLAIADTAAMLSHYLRKTDAFTKAQADLLYRPITYVPSWSEITGKPTFATVATTGSYNDLIDKPTIPTNNNQLTNGAGYITGLDTMSLIHTYDSTLYTTPYKSGLKVDSVTRISNSYYYWTKGVKHLISVATDSSSYHTLGQAPDSTYFTLSKPDGTVDTVPFPIKTEYDKFPLYNDGDTLKFRNDSLPLLTYGADVDTSGTNAMDIPSKKWVLDRISVGSGSPNSNIGSGYRLAVPLTNNIKTIFAVDPILLDSVTNTNALTFKFDTSLYHSTAYNNTQYGSLSQQNTNTSNIASNTTAIAGKQDALTLTTTGTSGAATLTGSTLNIPQYTGGGSGGGIDSVRQPLGTDSINQYSGGTGTLAVRTQRVFNVKNYGAKGDGVTNDQAAIQSAINACNAAGGGTVYFPNGIYILASATDASSNAQLYLPLNGYARTDTGRVIKLLGETSPSQYATPTRDTTSNQAAPLTGVILKSTLVGSTGAIIGSRSQTVSWGVFNFLELQMENITVRAATRSGSTIVAATQTAIDASKLFNINLKNIRIDVDAPSDSMVQPATTAIGLSSPLVNNFAFVNYNSILITGYYYGMSVREHVIANNIDIDGCYNGLWLTGTNFHGNQLTRVGIWRTKYNIRVDAGSSGQIDISQLASEDFVDTTYWWSNVSDMDEYTSTWQGTIKYARCSVHGTSSSAIDNTNFTRTGTMTNSSIKTVDVTGQSYIQTPSSQNQLFFIEPGTSNKMTIGRNGSTFTAAGSFIANDGFIFSSNDLDFYNYGGTAKWLCCGNTPSITMQLAGSSGVLTLPLSYAGQKKVQITNSNTATNAQAIFEAGNGSALADFGVTGTSYATYGSLLANSPYFYSPSGNGFTIMTDNGSGAIKFASGGNTEKARFSAAGNLLINTTTDNSKLTVNGSFATAYVQKSTSYTATISDHTIEVTATGQTITLPTAVGITGREYVIVYTAASGTATIATTSSQTFSNISGTPTTLTLSAPAAGAVVSYTLQSNGATWVVTAKVVN